MSESNIPSLTIDGGIAVISVNAPPVNALSFAVRQGLWQAFETAFADDNVQAIILICEGHTFFAGADISEFGKVMQEPSLVDLLCKIENAPKAVIAAIHGTALGGGLETALVCHYRVIDQSAKLGLPEVKLGLLPGAGGTQRLPRLVGAARSLEMVTSGLPISAKAALVARLVDELAPAGRLREVAVAFAGKVMAENWPLRRVRDLHVEGATPELFSEFRKANGKKFRGFEAPEANIQAIEAASSLSFDEGMKLERRLFEELRTGTQSKAQRHIFFAEREAAKIAGLSSNIQPRPIAKVGVIGAGTMGSGIAMNFLSAGIPVTIVETAQHALDRGMTIIRDNYEASARKGRITADALNVNMARLDPALDLGKLADCDLVIEAVYENMDVKCDIFSKLDSICKPSAILASNTSYLDLDEIAAATSRPESVVGLHFFSPANVMRLLEVVRGAKTDPAVLATAMKLAKTIGKVAVVSGVCHGFIGNRMLAQRRRQADRLILEGAMPWDVDRVNYEFGMPMGPFQISDLAGLDLGWSKESSRGETIRERLCEIDRRGQKAHAGFYDYDEKCRPTPSPVVEEMILMMSAQQGIKRRAVSDEEILERCVYPMINEGAKILDEGIAFRASDIDVVWVHGYGWPAYRGGPMFFGDMVGLEKIRNRLSHYAAIHGEDFQPSELLCSLADRGKEFCQL